MPGNLFTTRSRSFSTSSIRKRMIRSGTQHTSQKELIRSSTMTSFRPRLERLLHQGKIQQILNSDNHSKAHLVYSSHVQDMQKQLAGSKKSLSTMALRAKQKQSSINRLKNQIAKLERQKQAITITNESISKSYGSKIQTLETKKQSKQNLQWVQKSYIHIKERLLKDQYHNKACYEEKLQTLKAQKIRSDFLQRRQQQISRHEDELNRAVQQAKLISGQETHKKNQFIDLINQQRQEKQWLHDLKIDKHRKQNQINLLSSWVIQKEELNKYLNIIYTHRILSHIIRAKNSKLIQKYSQVQKAYLHIKSTTNIVHFQKILKKMQEQDHVYDVTVKRVADLEAEIANLEVTIENAKKQRNFILSQEGQLVSLQKQYYQGIEKDRYQLILSQKQKIQHRIIQDDILKQRITNWIQNLKFKLNVTNIQQQSLQSQLDECVQRLKVKNNS